MFAKVGEPTHLPGEVMAVLGWLFLCGVDTKTKSTNLGHMLMLIDMIDRYIYVDIYIIIYIYIYIYTHGGFILKGYPQNG